MRADPRTDLHRSQAGGPVEPRPFFRISPFLERVEHSLPDRDDDRAAGRATLAPAAPEPHQKPSAKALPCARPPPSRAPITELRDGWPPADVEPWSQLFRRHRRDLELTPGRREVPGRDERHEHFALLDGEAKGVFEARVEETEAATLVQSVAIVEDGGLAQRLPDHGAQDRVQELVDKGLEEQDLILARRVADEGVKAFRRTVAMSAL